jgi:hypothetical protein
MTTDIHRHDGKVIGYVEGDTFYKTNIMEHVHMLRKPPAWAVDVVSLDQAQQAGARMVHIHCHDTNRIYIASITCIRKKGRFIDRGHGSQYALYVKHWQVHDPNQMVLFGGEGR